MMMMPIAASMPCTAEEGKKALILPAFITPMSI